MEKLDLTTGEEEKPDSRPENQPIVHVHVPQKIEVEFSNPIVLGFQLGCGPFVMVLMAGLLFFLAVLMSDIAIGW